MWCFCCVLLCSFWFDVVLLFAEDSLAAHVSGFWLNDAGLVNIPPALPGMYLLTQCNTLYSIIHVWLHHIMNVRSEASPSLHMLHTGNHKIKITKSNFGTEYKLNVCCMVFVRNSSLLDSRCCSSSWKSRACLVAAECQPAAVAFTAQNPFVLAKWQGCDMIAVWCALLLQAAICCLWFETDLQQCLH